jgi:ubiquinone/menaquinone biosynthesis C-methylase UbiE
MLALPSRDACVAGIVAFYAIVHFSPPQLLRAFAEMQRVLAPGGQLLLAFHAGDEIVHVQEFLGRTVSLDFSFFVPEVISTYLTEIGFEAIDVVEREPYPEVEYPSRRAYLLAHKRGTQ